MLLLSKNTFIFEQPNLVLIGKLLQLPLNFNIKQYKKKCKHRQNICLGLKSLYQERGIHVGQEFIQNLLYYCYFLRLNTTTTKDEFQCKLIHTFQRLNIKHEICDLTLFYIECKTRQTAIPWTRALQPESHGPQGNFIEPILPT